MKEQLFMLICFLLLQGCSTITTISHIDCDWRLVGSFTDRKNEVGYFKFRNNSLKPSSGGLLIAGVHFRTTKFDWNEKGYNKHSELLTFVSENVKSQYSIVTYELKKSGGSFISEIMKGKESVVLIGRSADMRLALSVVNACINKGEVRIPPH